MITQEVLEVIGKWVVSVAERGTANFATFNSGATKLARTFEGQACHWALKNAGGSDYLVSTLKKKVPLRVLTEDVCRKYVKYMLESAWFSPYVETNPDEAWDKQYFIVNGEIDANVNIFLCIASRQLWEYPQVVQKTVKLCDMGLPFECALAFGNIVTEKNGMIVFSDATSGHSPLPGGITLSQYKSLLLRRYKPKQQGKVNWNYLDWFGSLIGLKTGNTVVNHFNGLCDKIASGYAHPFPRLAAHKHEIMMSVDDFYKNVLQFHNEMMQELQNEAA